MKYIFLIITTLIYIFGISIFLNISTSDIYYVRAQEQAKNLDFEIAIRNAKKGIDMNPKEPRYHYGLAKILLATAVSKDQRSQDELKTEALNHLKIAESLNPQNLVTLKNMIPIYYYLAINLSSDKSNQKIDRKFLNISKEYFEKVKEYSPKDVSIYTLTAKYEELLGETAMLENSKTKIVQLRPDLLEWYLTIPE